MHVQFILCACGCGQTRPATDSRGRSRTFIHNHSWQATRRKPPRPARPTAEQRFWRRVQKTDDCWLWQGSKDQSGYGHFFDERPIQTHRWAYIQSYGPIPNGMLVCHRCDIPGCVRPDHLFLGTAVMNMQDKIAKGRAWLQRDPAAARAVAAAMRAKRAAKRAARKSA